MEDFASLDSLNELCNAVDFDSLIESSEKPLEAKKTIRPLFLATMRPSRRKGFEDSLAIQEEELFFNDDPSIKFEEKEQVLCLDEDSGARRRATVLRDLGHGVFEVQFAKTGLKQATYATAMKRMTSEQIQAEEQAAVEVVDTNVSCVEDEKAMTVTTTMTLRHPVTKKEFQQTTTETRVKHVAEPPVAATTASAPVPADPKKIKEFAHVLEELFHTEREFGYRLEAVLLYYEKPIDVSNLLPPMARAVVFGNGSIAKLLALSQKVCTAAEGKSHAEQLRLYLQYLQDSRSYFNDQITSRSLGHVPLQSYLQSNAKFRKFAVAQIPLVEAFLQSKKITTHGHLGSVLYGPVQRLPRVMLLLDRMNHLCPGAEGVSEVLEYVKFVLNDFEKSGKQ